MTLWKIFKYVLHHYRGRSSLPPPWCEVGTYGTMVPRWHWIWQSLSRMRWSKLNATTLVSMKRYRCNPHRHCSFIQCLKSTITWKNKFSCRYISINNWSWFTQHLYWKLQRLWIFYGLPLHDTSTFIVWVYAILQLKKVSNSIGILSLILVG